ncbi:peptidylprolyl isomerase [Verrucomicrobiaceae bacterium N1E253]|uniref:peptidylprolyl isomerase n=1 Tax=Oceaniferula marina TaxID=2748318 RepID=A0A851GI42_9BACT|nr:SurA N-terminal domain-containing protein [Oceaniferula marina]NWK54885.1 peptidylprolyl isomerase [Oceaniferula marina]
MSLLKYTLGLSLVALTTISQAREVTGIAAKVNGRVITKNEINYHLTPYRQQLDAQMPRKGPQYEKFMAEATKDILDSLIERELILSEFHHKIKGRIPAHAIDGEIKRQIRELYNNNHSEYVKALKASGMTPQQHRRETEKKLIVQAMRAQQFANAVPPLPSEIQAEYNEHKMKMRDITGDALEGHKIYIPKADPNNPLATPETQLALAEDIVTKLKKGDDFEELARKHSADSYADAGGKVEKTPRTDLSPAFAAILMETDIGKILGPLEDARGFTIVRVDKKYYGPAPALSKVKKNIEARVRTKKNKAKQDRWIKRLKGNAMIDIKI